MPDGATSQNLLNAGLILSKQPFNLRLCAYGIRQCEAADGPTDGQKQQFTYIRWFMSIYSTINYLLRLQHFVSSRADEDFCKKITIRTSDQITIVSEVDLGFIPFLFAGPFPSQ